MFGHILRSRLLTCTALASIAFISQAAAQNRPAPDTTLQPIIVKGKRVPGGSVADTPLASQTTAEQISRKEIDSVADLGNTTEPGVDYVETKPGRAGGLFIRGLGGPRVVTLVDDIPIPYFENFARTSTSSPTTSIGDSANAFDFSSLSTVDVLRGADSSRVGPSALGGALVLRTLEPEDLIRDGHDWGAITKLTYDSENRSIGGSAAAAKRIGNTSVLFQGAYKRGHETESQGTTDIIGIRRTEANPMDFDQNNLMFKVRQDIEGGHRIGLTAERYDIQNETDLKTIQGTTYRPGDFWGYDDTRRERVSLDYSYLAPTADSLIDSAKLTAYWQRLDKSAGSYGFRTDGARYERDNIMEENAFGLTGGLVSEFETDNLSHQVRLGGNFQTSETEQALRAVPTSTVVVNQSDMPDVDSNRLGLYLEDRIGFGDSGFALTPGARFDWYDYSPKASRGFSSNTGFGTFGLPDGQDGVRISPKLLATYQLSPKVELFAQWSMAYRPPSINELYINFTNAGFGYANIGNPTLKPETSQGFEAGANYEDGDVSGKLTVYHNRYRNFIDTVVENVAGFPAGYWTWRNRAQVEITGVEVKARKDFASGFFMHGSLAYAYGKDKNTGEFLRTVAPIKSILGVGYQQEDWGVEATTILSGGMRKDGPAYDARTNSYYNSYDAAGYGLVNLAAWWEPEQLKGMRLQAGVYNIFDKTYYNAVGVRNLNESVVNTVNQPAKFYSEPGRTFKLSLTQRF